MTGNRHRACLLILILTLLLTSACRPSGQPPTSTSGKPAGDSGQPASAASPTRPLASASAGPLVLGDSEPLASVDIPAGGGKLVVSSPGHALDGLTIEVPPGAYDSDVSLTVTAQEVQSHSLGPYIDPVSPLIEIRGPEGLADEMLTLSIPIEVSADEFAMAFEYDPGRGPEPVPGKVSALTLLQSAEDLVVAATWTVEAIRILVSSIETMSLQGDVPTNFQHGVNDWHLGNFRSYLSYRGVCAGMNLAAIYYFLEDLGPPLFGRFDNYDNGYVATPGLLTDDEQALRLVSVLQDHIDWDNSALSFWKAYNYWLDDRMTYRALAYAMMANNEPQMVAVAGRDADGKIFGHSLLCYRKEGTTFYVSDSNFPKGQQGGDEERKLIFNDMLSGFQPYHSPSSAGGPSKTYTQVAFRPYQAYIDWSTLGQFWDQLEAGHVGDSEFPRYELWIQEEGDDGEQLLRNNHRASREKVAVQARSTAFKPYVVLRGSDLKPFAAGTGQLQIKLDEGENYIGFEIGHDLGDNEVAWVAFDWIKINYEAPEVVDPASIDLCDLLPPGGEGVRHEDDYGCSQSYQHGDVMSRVQVYRIPVGSQRACQQAEEAGGHSIIKELNVGDCGFVTACADEDSGEVVTGDRACWAAYFAVGDFRVYVHSGTRSEYPARSDWVMGKVTEVQKLLWEVAGVDS
jgi:hypothetical protein